MMVTRIIKFALSIFLICLYPGISSAQFAQQSQWGGTAGGSANALTLTVPNVASYADLNHVQIFFFPNAANTGATTVNINSIGAVSVTRADGTALQAGDLAPNTLAQIYGTGGAFVLPNVVTNFVPSSNIVAFTTSSSWTVPAGVYRVKYIQLWGAGGGGGASSGSLNAGGGGGGGAYCSYVGYPVVPGQSIPVVVGLGGSPGSGGGNGGAGGSTSFNSALVAGGGGGGVGFGGGSSGGSGGTTSGCQVGVVGGGGGPGYETSSSTPAGGQGGYSPFGGPPPSITVGTTNGANGTFPGSGATGGSGGLGGGVGGFGYALIQY